MAQAGLLDAAKNQVQRTVEANPVQALAKYIDKNTRALQSLLGDEGRVRRFQRVLLNVVQSDPNILTCTPESIVGSAMQAAILDLELDRALGHCYIVPFWNKKKGVKEAQFQLGYKGILELARRSGEIRDIFSVIVYENEPYELQYTAEGIKFSHTPLPPSRRGEKIAVYSLVQFKNGGFHLEWVWGEEVLERKKINQAVAKGVLSPWTMNSVTEEAMWLKTPIKKAAKYLPLTPIAKKAIELEEYRETTGQSVDYSKILEGGEDAVTVPVNEEEYASNQETSEKQKKEEAKSEKETEAAVEETPFG